MPKGDRGGKRGAGKTAAPKAAIANVVNGVNTKIPQDMFDAVLAQAGAGLAFWGLPMNYIESLGETNSAEAYAAASLSTKALFVNPSQYQDKDRLDRMYKNDVSTHWHPEGTTWETIIVHEVGHIVEGELGQKYLDKHPNVSWNQYAKYAFQGKAATDLVTESVRAVKKLPEYKGQKSSQIIGDISRYAQKSHHEAFAEAFADVYANGDKAKAISREIVRRAREALK